MYVCMYIYIYIYIYIHSLAPSLCSLEAWSCHIWDLCRAKGRQTEELGRERERERTIIKL